MAFFTNFGVRGNVGLLDWYTVSIAVFAVVLLAAHGATYLEWKTEGRVHDRCATYARHLWLSVIPLFLAISLESFAVRPAVLYRALGNPVCWLGLVVLLGATTARIFGLFARHELWAFLGSTILIMGLLAIGGAAIFPVMLYSTLAPQYSLDAYAVASSPTPLLLASFWWPIGFALATTFDSSLIRALYLQVQ